jgi:hypothetical protein
MVRTSEEQSKIGRRHCSALAGSTLFKGMQNEMRHFNVRLSIYGMGDAPAFVIKGVTSAFVMCDTQYECMSPFC